MFIYLRRLILVLGRGRYSNQGGIINRATQCQPIRHKQLADFGKLDCTQMMGL